ncbi:MAG: type II secretion system protein [Candidatus Pacebacteria bacterium]|nr:type II secretion system protein [Candidatus Paceibacterota bacterium]MDD5356696.1 type II secretion system protein [Candidatus Paceibacterota bacterium]
MKTTGGFTLIESVVYVALLALIMGGVLPLVYQILQGSNTLSGINAVQEEANFVLHKIDWALGGISNILSSFSDADTITIPRYDGNQVRFRLNTDKIEMSESGGTYLPITTANVAATHLLFHYIPAMGTGPAGVKVSFTLGTVPFEITKYIRK